MTNHDHAFHSDVIENDAAFQKQLEEQVRRENPELARALGLEREQKPK